MSLIYAGPLLVYEVISVLIFSTNQQFEYFINNFFAINGKVQKIDYRHFY